MNKYLIWICNGIAILLWSYLLGCGGGGDNTATYSVSGRILAANNAVIDSDVNDIFAEYASNDTIDDAQTIPNPAILGGYVNTPETGWVGENGEVGRSYFSGDQKDFYSVTLTSDQTITLYIADFSDTQPDIDIDLYLYDENGITVDSSVGTGSSETVDAPAAGDYFIEVRAFSGASNYIFTVGQPVMSATVLDPRMNEDFAPGHVIAAFHEVPKKVKQVSGSITPTPFHGMEHRGLNHGSMRLYHFTLENRQQVFEALKIPPSETNRALYQTWNE
ncbi:MAG: PPC domain-containing protein, partial [Deltaproteobacteria bacterium]|nr:PPC domain-containing protein [Deltaproteobacteria bacterium]